MDEMIEKRKYPRFPCPLGKAGTITSAGDQGFMGTIKDISRGGIAISSTQELADDEIDLTIHSNDLGRQIPVTVKVLWSDHEPAQRTYGGTFLRVASADKYDLLDYFYENWKKNEIERRRQPL